MARNEAAIWATARACSLRCAIGLLALAMPVGGAFGQPLSYNDQPLAFKSDEWLNSEIQPHPSWGGRSESFLEDEGDCGDEEWAGLRGISRKLFHPWRSLPLGRPFYHGDPDDPDRYMGPGQPLVGTSWLNRPLSAGFFAGGLFGDEPFAGRVNQGGGLFGGVRAGYDFDHYTGFEARVGLTSLELFDSQNLPLGQTSGIFVFDTSLLYYPWGDSRWRPYASVGLGLVAVDLFDEQQRNFKDVLLLVPIGLGLKYHYCNWYAWRVDALDNVAVGNGGINTTHNLSLSAGLEIRYGGQPRLYYPAHPGVVRW